MLKPDKWKIALKVSIVFTLGLLFLVMAGATWDYSNSSQFCASCHTMEFVTSSYSTSPHAEVSCTNCHLGVGFSPVMLFKKATEVNQVVKNVTGTYDKPIRIRTEIPVENSCESCHYPKTFYDQSLKVKNSFAADLENTPVKTAMLINTGGGADAWGIHWHVENKIVYGKNEAGEIVHVAVETNDGRAGVYRKEDGGEPVAYRQMSCVDCHNRVAHRIYEPGQVVDQYLTDGRIDSSLPYVKRELIEILTAIKDVDPAEWPGQFAASADFYQQNYPDVYSREQEKIHQLPELLAEMAGKILFPDMKVTWETYADNLSHEGCFQCHNQDFQLVEESASGHMSQKIRMDCQLCHSTPVSTAGEGQVLTVELK